MSTLAIVYAVFGDAGEARRIARQMVEERLAACANILGPVGSVYRWQGKVEEAEEVAVLFKTADGRVPALRERIAALHSYDLPAVIAWPASAGGDYANWIAEISAAAG